MEIDAEWLQRLAHYAHVYIPGPKWDEKEAAGRAKQAHLDGVVAEEMASLIEEDIEAWREFWRKLVSEPT